MQFKKFGKYSVIKKVASGGMADILLSISLSPTGFGRFVVIKKALAKFSSNSEFNEMFKNEAKVACNLKHKNITPIYEFGIEKDQFFLTMEYISGKNLREITKKIASQRKELGIDNAVYIIKEVAAGLNYAHNAIDSNTGLPLNIIHRDVSPQNIMVSFDGEIKLIDFGIAKIADTNLTKAGHLKGKFSYMSPEQAQGEQLDERTDIFCLGVILWEILTGKRLFASENEMASLKKVRNCNIPSAQKINPKIPTELNDIIMKALSKNKNLRYKTASKFERDLNLFLNKNYAEYSHYNLTFLVKTVYRKEVMQEREKLKIYSSEFKKYINALNLEKTLSSNEINFNTINMDIASQAFSKNTAGALVKTKTRTVSPQNSNLSLIEPETQSELESMEGSFIPTEEHSHRSTQSESTIQIQNETEASFSEQEAGEELSRFLQNKKQSDENFNQKTSIKEFSRLKKNQKKPMQSANLQITHNNFLNKEVHDSSTKPRKPTVSEKFDFNKIKLENPNSKQTYTKSSKNTFFHTVDTEGFLKRSKRKNRIKSIYLNSFYFLIFSIVSLMFFYFKDFFLNKQDVATFNQASKAIKETLPANKAAPSTQPRPSAKSFSLITQSPKSVQKKVFIRSKPSNAGIYINNNFISKYTPYMITLSSDKSYSITIKKPGYFSKSFQINSNQSRNNIEINLIRKTKQKRDSISIVY